MSRLVTTVLAAGLLAMVGLGGLGQGIQVVPAENDPEDCTMGVDLADLSACYPQADEIVQNPTAAAQPTADEIFAQTEDARGGFGGYCWAPRPGDGTKLINWSPALVVNSPYQGSASVTEIDSYTSGWKFGTAGFEIDLSDVVVESTSISVADGHSVGLYFLAKWHWVHGQLGESVGSACWGTGPVIDFWFIWDSTPLEDDDSYFRVFDLTGPSTTTDADNLLVPDDTEDDLTVDGEPYEAISLDYRYKEADQEVCVTASANPLVWEFSEYHNIGVVIGGEAKIPNTDQPLLKGGYTTASTNGEEATYTFPGGNCWDVDDKENNGKAFSHKGFSSDIKPFATVEWPGREYGCDGPYAVEHVTGEFDTQRYYLAIEAGDGNLIEFEAMARGSAIYGMDPGDFSEWDWDWNQAVASKGAVDGALIEEFATTVELDVNFELDEVGLVDPGPWPHYVGIPAVMTEENTIACEKLNLAYVMPEPERAGCMQAPIAPGGKVGPVAPPRAFVAVAKFNQPLAPPKWCRATAGDLLWADATPVLAEDQIWKASVVASYKGEEMPERNLGVTYKHVEVYPGILTT